MRQSGHAEPAFSPATTNSDAVRGLQGEAAVALERARDHLLSVQQEDGHWVGELEGDTILESEYIMAMHFLGRLEEEKVAKAGEYLRRQRIDGAGWANYPGGPTEVSVSTKAYFALKLLGDSPGAKHMREARRAVLDLGGLEACNSFTKIYLAIFGQYEWRRCPAVVPEMMLLPERFFFNIHAMSSWSRAIVVPLSIIWALQPSRAVPDHARIGELAVPEVEPTNGSRSTNGTNGSHGSNGTNGTNGASSARAFWRRFFSEADRGLKLVERVPFKPLRERALKLAEQWILDHVERSDGLGGIFPPIVNAIIALTSLGYSVDHPVVRGQIAELERLEIHEEETVRIQPCFSPVWDTALSVNALLDAGIESDDPRLQRAAQWLLDREVKRPGDWQARVPRGAPGGWYFQYSNEHYPDCDDTAEVLKGLSRIRLRDNGAEDRRKAAIARAVSWLRVMQNQDGGWGAFDRGCDQEILTYVPFADHNAMIDPSCEDITGRTLETFHGLGIASEDPSMRSAVSFLLAKQDRDGSWYGRWGCNHIYGTWLAVTGLAVSGAKLPRERLERAATWLERHQNEDGGWGESPRSYDEPSEKGRGPSTSAQTAWAVLALMAVHGRRRESVLRGIRYLLDTQKSDGSWYDEAWTGTGFPRVFYLRYHLYAVYFPLLALAQWGRERE